MGILKELRDERPSSKIVTITNFSVIKERFEPYESSPFDAAGYTWRLILYVTGNKKDGGENHISLYVRIEDTESLPEGWELSVDLKLFVHNRRQSKYLAITDGRVKKYNEGKKEWGFGQLISLSTFYSANEGYLVQDTASFGAEISIVKPVQVQEKMTGATSVWRDEKPSSKIVTITSFSVIKERGEPYESSVFESSGYKWRLILYVTGNKNDGGNGYISLYVRIEETQSLPRGWEVNVDLKLFVHNAKLNKYLAVTDGAVKRYNEGKKEWGFGQLIALSTFYNVNEGYLVQDTCSFGAEISIVKPVQVQEKVTFISNPKVAFSDPSSNVFTWKILHFSTLEDKFYYSNDFLVEDRYWRLGFNPKGNGGGRPHALPLFLFGQGFRSNAVATTTWGAVNLRLKNQRSTNHIQLYSAAWYPISPGYGVGVNNIILFTYLNDRSKGFLVNDSIVFEAEMVKVSVTNVVSV